MKHPNFLTISIVLSFVFSSCNSTKSLNQQMASEIVETSKDSVAMQSNATIYPQFIPSVFYTYTCDDGQKREFIDLYIKQENDFWSSHHLYAKDGDGADDLHYISLMYQRYEDTPDYYAFIGGCPRPFHYLTSTDGNTLYLVTGVYANSNGWTTEYQLFKIDCNTLEATFLCECAAIRATDNGFTIAVAGLTNRETATCTADEDWVLHDEQLDWNGNITNVSKKEYSYKKMLKKYQTEGFTYIRGFNVQDVR